MSCGAIWEIPEADAVRFFVDKRHLLTDSCLGAKLGNCASEAADVVISRLQLPGSHFYYSLSHQENGTLIRFTFTVWLIPGRSSNDIREPSRTSAYSAVKLVSHFLCGMNISRSPILV
jgi:hypothetical protein